MCKGPNHCTESSVLGAQQETTQTGWLCLTQESFQRISCVHQPSKPQPSTHQNLLNPQRTGLEPGRCSLLNQQLETPQESLTTDQPVPFERDLQCFSTPVLACKTHEGLGYFWFRYLNGQAWKVLAYLDRFSVSLQNDLECDSKS